MTEGQTKGRIRNFFNGIAVQKTNSDCLHPYVSQGREGCAFLRSSNQYPTKSVGFFFSGDWVGNEDLVAQVCRKSQFLVDFLNSGYVL